METQQYKYDLFISYSADGRGWVKGYLEPKLRRAGKSYFLEDDFATGKSELEEAERAIMLSRQVIFVITPMHAAKRGASLVEQMTHVKGEKEGRWSLLPVLLKPVDPTLLQRTLQFVDLTDELGKEEAEQRLWQGVGLSGVDEGGGESLDSPYPGMKPFDEQYVQYFFGREKQVDECLHYLRNNRFLALIGSSGCGKSSLVRAGIVPPLQRDKNWVIKILRPGQKPFDTWLQQYGETAFSNAGGLVQHLLSENTDAQYLLVVIDQFEEVFALDHQDADQKQNGLGLQAQAFLKKLAALRGQDNVNIILTVRDEFFPQLAWCAEWLDVDPHLQRVGSLGREGLADAIRKPAARIKDHKVWIDELLIERLVNDAGDDPGILPFVQETMNLLWEKKEESFISLQHYEKLEKDGVSGLRYAIAAKADSAFKALPSDAHRAIAKRIFIRLVQFGENGKPDTRRSQLVSHLCSTQYPQSVFNETLQHLTSDNYRLLILSGGDKVGDALVDIVHESLIKAWPQFQKWLYILRGLEEIRRSLEKKYTEWVRLNYKGGFLDKLQLKEALDWKGNFRVFGEDVDESFLVYINASKINLMKSVAYRVLLSLLMGFVIFLTYYGFYAWMNFQYNSVIDKENPMVKLDEGDYVIGQNYNKDEDGYPLRTEKILGFQIDSYEVSNYWYK